MTRARRTLSRGYLLAHLLLILSVITLLVLASATWRSQRERLSRRSYARLSADSLARSGLEAAIASLGRGEQPQAQPLGERVPLTGAWAALEVDSPASEGERKVTSCATVHSQRLHVPPIRRCVTATLRPGPPVSLLSWEESGTLRR